MRNTFPLFYYHTVHAGGVAVRFQAPPSLWLGLRLARLRGLRQALGVCLRLVAPLAVPRLQRRSPNPHNPQT